MSHQRQILFHGVGYAIVFVVFLVGSSVRAGEQNPWHYEKGKDDFTDIMKSHAYSTTVDAHALGAVTVGFLCDGRGGIRFDVDADRYLAQKGDKVRLKYRVDKNDPIDITLSVFSNSNSGAFTYSNTERLAEQTIKGGLAKIRIVTWDNEYIEAVISLTNAEKQIPKVYEDCGNKNLIDSIDFENINKPSEDKIRAIQKALSEWRGGAFKFFNGAYSPRLRRKIERFQESAGYTVDGNIDDTLLKRIRKEPTMKERVIDSLMDK